MEASVVEGEIQRVISEIWKTTLRLPIEVNTAYSNRESAVCARIDIHDAWQGSLLLAMESPLAVLATRAVFSLDCSVDPTPDESNSVVAELLNVTAGNLKTVLPEPCVLGIPKKLTSYSEWTTQGEPLFNLAFSSCDMPFAIELTKHSRSSTS
jgi:hypothetical protein